MITKSADADPTGTAKGVLNKMQEVTTETQDKLDIMDVFFFEGQQECDEQAAKEVPYVSNSNNTSVLRVRFWIV